LCSTLGALYIYFEHNSCSGYQAQALQYDLIVYIGKKMNMLEIKAEVSHCSERDWHLN